MKALKAEFCTVLSKPKWKNRSSFLSYKKDILQMFPLVTQDLNVDWNQPKTKGQFQETLFKCQCYFILHHTVKLPLGKKYKKLNCTEEKEISWRTIFT